ncbi:glycosyltransferase [Blautia obeum]|uniref:Glycosyltransferase family 4 protein n=1 Tax=Blautia obeum TaxID=40520 RepID=A0A411ZK13_9FIRM|nr:glycosyltransferase [Blautia obeum]RGQ03165.1 glycosyltransferase family 4 protein [Blautia obeum]
MKKIIFYIDSMQMGGAQRVMNNLIDYFVCCESEVILVNDIVPSREVPEYDINRKVKRLFLDEKQYSGIKKNIHRIKALRRILKEEAPEVVVSFLGPPNMRMLLSAIGIRIKKVVSVRNDPYKEYGSGIKKIIAKIVFLLADGCVFQTEDAQKYFFKRTRKKSTIIFNPVNVKFYNKKWKMDGSDIVIIGRLQEQKNPILALNAFISIADEFKWLNLKYYGDEELASSILKIAQENNLSNRVEIVGKTSNVENVLEHAALFVLSSDYEGMPNALMEAMTVGVPVISTDCPCGGPRMLITNSTQGVLVPCGDEKKLASAMRMVLKDRCLQEKMSECERKRSEEFHPPKILLEWEHYLNSYGELKERDENE